MTRRPAELLAEIAKWKRRSNSVPPSRRRKDATPREHIEGETASVEAAGAAVVVSALTWALGETNEPTVRTKL